MNQPRQPEDGEVLKLGPPASGEVIIKVDPSLIAAPFAAGTQSLSPRAEIPVHRHLDRDVMLFIHKGQGRATLEERTMAVVPGVMLYVPRGAWQGLRNTGTGILQIAWAGPPGLEIFFRDLSRLGASPSAEALQEVAQRHQVEFRPASAAPPDIHRPHRRRRGGRHRSGQSRLAQTPPPVSAPPSSRQPRKAPSSSPAPQPPSGGGRRQRPGRRPPYRRKVKEVYMGGRWVRVEGEGPVIAPGRQSGSRGSKQDRDDDAPPLSVPL